MSISIRGMVPLLQVFDMPTSLAFYRDVLGFSVTQQSRPGDSPDWVLLEGGGTELMLNTAYEAEERPPAPDARRVAAHEDTGLFFGCPDVDQACAYFREKGVSVGAPVVAPYGMKQLWVRDPDGYQLCFQWKAG